MAAKFDFASALPDKLLGQDHRRVSTADALAGNIFGLYFSAHWCPPCRAFTPKLADTYLAIQDATGLGALAGQSHAAQNAAGNAKKKKRLEIVFVSSDKGDDQFDEYFR